LFGVVEVDESWFGARNIRGKRGRGAYGKTIVFGIFERAGQVYTEIVPDCSRATLQGIIRGRVDVSSVINSDGWRSYNGLVDLGYGHLRVDHGNDEFVKGAVHINGIEGFWGLAKVRLAKFKGLPRHTFHLHLKETEWRYNNRHADSYKILLALLRNNPLN
jgi:transposase-like protein